MQAKLIDQQAVGMVTIIKNMKAITVLVSLLLSSIVTIATSTTYHVTPTSLPSCPDPLIPCLTLSEYATRISSGNISTDDNTTLVLLPGNHTLWAEFSIKSVASFSVSAMDNDTANITVVYCSTSQGEFTFRNVTQVRMSGIYLSECTENVFSQIDQLYIEDVQMGCHNDCNRGTGLFVANVNDAKIERSSFKSFKGTTSFNQILGSLNPSQDLVIGGAFITTRSKVTVIDSIFEGNNAGYGGGAMYIANDANVTVCNTIFRHNSLRSGFGGAIFLRSQSYLYISNNSVLYNNTVIAFGGGITAEYSTLFISDTLFDSNTAGSSGGAVYAVSSVVTVERSTIRNGNASLGGGLYAIRSSIINVSSTLFHSNAASDVGAAIAFENTDGSFRDCTFLENRAPVGFAGILNGNFLFSDGCSFMRNLGSFILLSTNATFAQNITFMNNTNNPAEVTDVVQSQLIFNDLGGALTLLRSDVLLYGNIAMTQNDAINAGAILTLNSRMTLSDGVDISQNRAKKNGGACVAYYSTIVMKGGIFIEGNTAGGKGGGFFLISTTIEVHSDTLLISNNTAIEGGGIFFEQTSKLHIIKGRYEFTGTNPEDFINVTFSRNQANLGAAMFVSDFTSSAVCSNLSPVPAPINDCFIQTYQAHIDFPVRFFNIRNYYFVDNVAFESAPVLYGGLLDRCTLNALSEVIFNRLSTSLDALEYFQMISNINSVGLISSEPVRVCFCTESPTGELSPACDLVTIPTMSVKKGATLTLSVVAVNQVDKPLDAIIHGELSSFRSGFSEAGQTVQRITNTCTPLQYNIISPDDSDTLHLNADGPCDNAGISELDVPINFLPCECGIGFQPSSSSIICECVCDSRLSPYITQCQENNLIREANFWVGYTNVSGPLCMALYPQCPFDYCNTPSDEGDPVNLNAASGADVQCAFNRTGKLCGQCQEGLSLALGGSNCIPCTNAWLALLIPFAILGILIVIFVMLCNLTVAIGTINGLVFYANIFALNRSIFLPLTFNKIPASFFYVSWVNLDWGFETCFYDGMDSYAKTWLQLVFPLYIFGIVFAIMIISTKSQRFAHLLNDRNPVATLATLILLSYTKIVRVIISALSYATLACVDGSSEEIVWRFDGSVGYLKGEHIPLFIVTVVILAIGFLYTLLLLFGQWLALCPNWKILKWTRNTKFMSFMDAYHAPYNPRHRYWVGLLLFVRIFLYLVSSYNSTGNPYISLYCVMFAVVCLLAIKQLSSRIYKNRFVDALETSFFMNLVIFSGATLFIRDSNSNQTALAFTSFAVVIVTTMFILGYHGYEYIFKRTETGEKFTTSIKECLKKVKVLQSQPVERQKTVTILDNSESIDMEDKEHCVRLRDSCLEFDDNGTLQEANLRMLDTIGYSADTTFAELNISPGNGDVPLSVQVKEETKDTKSNNTIHSVTEL